MFPRAIFDQDNFIRAFSGSWNVIIAGDRGPVYTNPFLNENGAVLFPMQLSSTLQRQQRSLKTEPFENSLQSGAIWKRWFLKTLFSSMDGRQTTRPWVSKMAERRSHVASLLIRRCSVGGRKRYENGLVWTQIFLRTKQNSFVSVWKRIRVDRAWIRNATLSPTDKRDGRSWKATNYRYSLVSLMDGPLSDIYRQIHPIAKSFTNESKPLNLKSGTDFFLISRSLSCFVKN